MGGVADVLVPALGWDLAGDDRGSRAVAVLEHFEEVAALGVGDRRHRPVVERFLLELELQRLDQVEASIATMDVRIDEKLEPYRMQHQRLMQIPGVDRVGAAVIIAELGVDMSVFPTPQHAAAWAGVCPGNNESAGKRKSQPGRKGNIHLTTALVQAAVCSARKKGSYLKEKYWRLRARRGPKRAALAIAHKILLAAFHMLKDDAAYRDLGAEYLDRASTHVTRTRLVKHLERLGYKVHLEPAVH